MVVLLYLGYPVDTEVITEYNFANHEHITGMHHQKVKVSALLE